MKKIAIIEGGYSSERAISLKSAATVFNHLDQHKYDLIKVSIDQNGWYAFYQGQQFVINKDDFSFSYQQGNQSVKINFDFAFIVIHGTPGEDGKLQAYFDLLAIPYSTCDQLASAVTFNKYLCNRFLHDIGIPVATSVLLHQSQFEQKKYNKTEILTKVALPCFIKPAEGGSSFGVSKLKHADDFEQALIEAFAHGDQVIIESFLAGREVSNGVYLTKNGLHILPVTEIISHHEFFDYNAKYHGDSEEITPADLSPEVMAKIHQLTEKAYLALNLKGICRIDYIITEQGCFLLEINTVPGFSNESIVPQMARHQGISLQQLFTDTLEYALVD